MNGSDWSCADQLPAATISTMGSGGGNHVIRVTGSVTLCISAPEKEYLTTIKSSTGTLEIFYSRNTLTALK